jgi:hypothetical protein
MISIAQSGIRIPTQSMSVEGGEMSKNPGGGLTSGQDMDN